MAGTSDKWTDHAKRHLKAQLKRADVTYAELAKRLIETGILEMDTSVAAKVHRGAFPARFLFAVMRAISAHNLARGGVVLANI